MKHTINLSIFLALSFFAQSQEVIAPSNFLKDTSTNNDEAVIDAYELPGGSGYLFSMSLYIPHNLVPGESFSSAKLVKADINGNVAADFIVPADTANRIVYKGKHACVRNNEVLFFVIKDSTMYNGTNTRFKNLGIFIYHLDENTLSLRSVDSFLNILPFNSSIWTYYQVASPTGSVYIAIGYADINAPISKYNNLILKMDVHSDVISINSVPITSQLIPTMKDNDRNDIYNIQLNANKDSVEIFMTTTDTNFFQIYRFITIDTSFTSIRYETVPYVINFQYKPNKFVSILGGPVHVIKSGINKMYAGPLFRDAFNDRLIGLIRYDIQNAVYDKALIIPDTSFSQFNKSYAPLSSIEKNNDNLFCLGFDCSSEIIFSPSSNHLYLGKADTSLNAWHWYKYIGVPNRSLFPFRLLATSDGGCIVTCGIYDYLNNPNLEYDVFIIKLNANGVITNVSNLTPKNNRSVSIFPVPAQNELFLSYEGNESYHLLIYDVAGKLVINKSALTKNDRSISIQSLATGNYIYQLRFKNGEVENGKLIKE